MSSAQFELLSGRPHRRRRLFRTVQLNAAGRLALVGLSLVSAGLGAAVAAVLGAPWWIGALVALPLVVLVLVVTDRRRSGRALTSWSWTDDLAEVEAAALVLRQQGIEVEIEDDPESHPRLVFRASETRRVADVLHLPVPPQPQRGSVRRRFSRTGRGRSTRGCRRCPGRSW